VNSFSWILVVFGIRAMRMHKVLGNWKIDFQNPYSTGGIALSPNEIVSASVSPHALCHLGVSADALKTKFVFDLVKLKELSKKGEYIFMVIEINPVELVWCEIFLHVGVGGTFRMLPLLIWMKFAAVIIFRTCLFTIVPFVAAAKKAGTIAAKKKYFQLEDLTSQVEDIPEHMWNLNIISHVFCYVTSFLEL
ncbi:hypothetical protein ACJX0J_023200, partial [Zea mays]